MTPARVQAVLAAVGTLLMILGPSLPHPWGMAVFGLGTALGGVLVPRPGDVKAPPAPPAIPPHVEPGEPS